MSHNQSNQPGKDIFKASVSSRSGSQAKSKNKPENNNRQEIPDNSRNKSGNLDIIQEDNVEMKDEVWLNEINQKRIAAELNPLNVVYCKNCHAVNKHFEWDCPSIICKICAKGHITYECPNKPKICQWCGKDINPLNYDNVIKIPHKNFGDCPKRSFYYAKRFIKCLICKKLGHTAVNCRFKNTRKYNQNYKKK